MVNFQLIGATMFPFIGGGLGSMITRKEIPTWYKVGERVSDILYPNPKIPVCHMHISDVKEAMVQSSKLGIWSGVDDVIRQHGICQLLGLQGRRRLPRGWEDRSAFLWHTTGIELGLDPNLLSCSQAKIGMQP